MDRPRLRPLDAYPVDQNGQKLLALSDPSGVSENVATLPPAAVAVIQLCDGEHTREQICDEFYQKYRQKLSRDALDGLIDQLDQALLLDSDRFRQHSAKLFAEYAKLESRPASHADKSYTKDPEKLRRQLDAYFDPPNGPGKPQPGTGDLPRAIVTPHIDFSRGGPAYAWAYRPLADARELPEAIVVFGTDHIGGSAHPFVPTRKHFETPLGAVRTDRDLVAELARRTAHLKGGGDDLFADEHHHRGEHSLEFQMVWLRHLLGDRLDGISILPILGSSFQEFIDEDKDPWADERVGGFLSTLGELMSTKRTLWIAGADLAHVGPRYGDMAELSKEDKESLEKRDMVTLEHVKKGDPKGWYKSIRAERDRRRVCGLTPIYGMLGAARPGPGHLAVYAQCPAESNSVVSIASLIYPGTTAAASADNKQQ